MNVNGSSGVTASARAQRRGVARLAALAQRGQGDRVPVLAVDHDDVAERGQPLADLADLGRLRRVLADDRDGLGVPDDPLALLRGVGRVDRDDHPAHRRDREVDVGPFGPGVAEDRYAIARLYAEVHQAEPDLLDRLAELAHAHVDPLAVALVAERDAVRPLLCRAQDEVRDGLGASRAARRAGAGLHVGFSP